MEREILFRGQTRKRGEKVYMDGTPFPGDWVCGGIFAPNADGDRLIIYDYDDCKKYPVYTDTVGRFTGLHDRNGAMIFEGDIVYIAREDERGIVKWDKDGACFEVVIGNISTTFRDNWFGHDLEVIGNVHDNPKLVGGDNDAA